MEPTALTTVITPTALFFSGLMCALIIVIPRKYALVPVLALTCYMTLSIRVMVAGLDFTMIRLLVLAGWVRILLRREVSSLRLCYMDRLVLTWVAVTSTAYIALRHDFHAVINQSGCDYNILGMYFLFRVLVRDTRDVLRMFKICAVLLAPLAIIMIVERVTYNNVLMAFYGLKSAVNVRDGEVRCQASFGHPILAGVFAATMVPWFVTMLLHVRRSRLVGWIGLASSLTMTFISASSTPILAAVAGCGAMMLWSVRRHMRAVRWTIVGVLTMLQIVMKAPVWFVIARAAVVGGSTAWHRAYLIDRAIANLPDWWLLGTTDTGTWGSRLSDVTNQFLGVGADGGIFAMLLFILVLAAGFRSVGRAYRRIPPERSAEQRCVWALGCSLFAHVIAFIGVAYWDQTIVGLYVLLAAMASLSITAGLLQPGSRSGAKANLAREASPTAPAESVLIPAAHLRCF